MTEQQLRQKVVGVISAWVGAPKGSNTHHQIIDIYNSKTPLPRRVRMSYTMDWCAATVSAAGIVAGLADIIFPECSCSELIKLYKAKERWIEDDAYIPKPGDLVMYSWGDDGVGDCRKAPNHVGMVTDVTGTTITVVEGNMGSRSHVGIRKLQVDGRYIRGYCCPDYASMSDMKQEKDMKLYRYVSELPYGQEAVTRAIQSGHIQLNSDGSMGLWESNIQTVILMDRAGLFDKPAIAER